MWLQLVHRRPATSVFTQKFLDLFTSLGSTHRWGSIDASDIMTKVRHLVPVFAGIDELCCTAPDLVILMI